MTTPPTIHRAATLMVFQGLTQISRTSHSLALLLPVASARRVNVGSLFHAVDGMLMRMEMKGLLLWQDEAMESGTAENWSSSTKLLNHKRIVRWLPMRYALGIYLVCRRKSKVMKVFLPQGCFIDDTFTDADPVTGKVDISADLSFNSRGQGNCAAQKTCICEIPLQNPSEADGGEQGDCYEVITNGTCSRDRGLFNIMAKEDCENGAYYKKLPVHKVSSNDPSAHANLPYGCFLQEDDPDNPRLRLNSGDEYVFKQARAECTATSPCVCKKVKHVECCCLIRLSSVYFFNCSIPYFLICLQYPLCFLVPTLQSSCCSGAECAVRV